MHNAVEKPKMRSSLRLALGRYYYTLKRLAWWTFGGVSFASKFGELLPFVCFSHATPLLRRLKDVDMQLQHNKVTNLKIAVPKISGIILHPGQTLSYWKLIGKPTHRKGYLKGMVLQNGHFMAGTGGGLCQLSNLIYWMTLHTPLTVTERHRHGFDVFPDAKRTQPFGSGATCFYNYGDLMIENRTDAAFQLVLEVTGTELKGAWHCSKPPNCSYEVYEKEHFIRQEYWGGYTRHNTLYRTCLSLDGTLLHEEYLTENHAIMMYAPLLPAHKETPSSHC